MATQGAVCWVLLTTVLCGAVSAAVHPASLSPDSPGPDRVAQVTLPRSPERPLLLARNHRHERRRDWRHGRHERRREWHRERRQEWRRERREAAVAAGIGGLIIGGVVGAAAASARWWEYEQSISNYPNYSSDYGYPYPR